MHAGCLNGTVLKELVIYKRKERTKTKAEAYKRRHRVLKSLQRQASADVMRRSKISLNSGDEESESESSKWGASDVYNWKNRVKRNLLRKGKMRESLFKFFVLFEEAYQLWVWTLAQFLRRVKLLHAAKAQHKDLVWANYRVQTVSDRDHCRVMEIFFYELHDGPLRYDVDVCRRLIKNYDFCLADWSSTNANELLLTHREIVTVLVDLEVTEVLSSLYLDAFVQAWAP